MSENRVNECTLPYKRPDLPGCAAAVYNGSEDSRTTDAYRKPINADNYLLFGSQRSLEHTLSAISVFNHRATHIPSQKWRHSLT